jgi:hypothetical protein
MKEALISSETSVLTRATRRKLTEDTILDMKIFSEVTTDDCNTAGMMVILFN